MFRRAAIVITFNLCCASIVAAVPPNLYVGFDPGSNETYEIDSGIRDYWLAWAGIGGDGTLLLSGGTINTTELGAGSFASGHGTIVISGTAVVSALYFSSGWYGAGLVRQEDDSLVNVLSSLNVPMRRVGPAPPGYYVLNSGTLMTGTTYHDPTSGTSVGAYGDGTFIQNGGFHQTDQLHLGWPGFGHGVYQLNGGT